MAVATVGTLVANERSLVDGFAESRGVALGYAAVVVILALAYVGGAVWLATTLFDGEAPLFVAASTLAAAALFKSLSRRILSRVDRRFHRARCDTARVVELGAVRVRDETDLDSIVDEPASAVSETMHPSSVGAWLRVPFSEST